MTGILLILALAAFVAVGAGVGLVRSEPRPALTGTRQAKLHQWLGTLAGRRLTGALLVVGGALAFLAILAFRP